MDAGDEVNIKSRAVYRLFFLCLVFLGSSQSSAELTDYGCGSIKNAYGPFDYRSGGIGLKEVEGNHLTPEVINLVRGKTGYIGSDLDYILRAFPNHHVALMAMVRLGEKEKTVKPIGANYVVECYLKRALLFRSDDGVVRTIYASYLYKAGKKTEALNQLNEAVKLGEDNPNTNYNIGLIYFDLKDYENALSFAQRAYGSGFPLPGLRDKLKRVGKWEEPVSQKGNGDAQITNQ